MPKVLIVDPASAGRDGWHEVYGSADGALNGNVSRVFLTGVPLSVPTSGCRQPDDWSCGPYSLAECLGQANGEDARNWLLARGLITSRWGTTYSGIVAYLNAKGYGCDYDGRDHDGEMNTPIFERLISHLQGGRKVILCMHHARNTYWTKGGHYICVYGVQGTPKTDHTFTCPQIGLNSTGAAVKLWQTLLKARGLYDGALDGSFGDKTCKATIKFQKYCGIKQDCLVGPTTWGWMIPLESTTQGSSVIFTAPQISIGFQGNAAYFWQDLLRGLGYINYPSDFSFGSKCRKATAEFQKAHKLSADGIAGPKTFKAAIGF